MADVEKQYIGTLDCIHKAAMIYDLLQIQSKGMKAKTNFIYRKKEILAILQLKKISPSGLKQRID